MRKLFAFCAILIQPLAMYLQVYDIAAKKGYQVLFYVLGVVFIVLGTMPFVIDKIAKKKADAGEIADAEKKAAAGKGNRYMVIAEGVILLLAPIFASRYVEKMENWETHLRALAAEERYGDLTPYEQYRKALEYAGPGEWHYLKAIELARSAADRGCVEAFDLLGQLYARGLGCKVDYEAAAFNFVQSSLNGRQSLPEWVKLFPEIRNAENPKVRKVIDECEKDAAFTQYIGDELNLHRGHPKDLIKVLNSAKDQLELLSEKGYREATGELFTLANLTEDEDAVYFYSRRMADSRHVPDYPMQRYFIYRFAYPNLPVLGDTLGKEDLKRLIADEDFFITLDRCDTLSLLRMKEEVDSHDLYRYTLAQYNRCRYLKENRRTLVSYMARNEDFDAYYDFAADCHRRSINTIESDLAEKYPPVFDNQ